MKRYTYDYHFTLMRATILTPNRPNAGKCFPRMHNRHIESEEVELEINRDLPGS